MPVPVMGLVPQPTLEDDHMESTMISSMSEISQMSVGVSYTLWRNPGDRSDPANLAELDESMRRGLAGLFPAPRPRWLIEQVERMRFPLLWEAVRTTWHRDASEFSTVPRILVEHANYVLVNRFRTELGLTDIGSHRFAYRLTERVINPRATVTVDGIESPACEIDTDPFVYAVGAQLGPSTVVTAVVPRDELDCVDVAFAQRALVDRRS
ncbi:hypothetical protein [Agreia bicolorata]|nr:hypothetical protein [Agreia bicolorata]